VRRLGVDVGKKFKIGELSSIETLSEAFDKFVSSDYAKKIFLGKVARTGNFDFVKYFWKVKKCRKSYRVASGAASGGHLELLKCLHEKKWKVEHNAGCSAAGNGHLECFKYLIEEVKLGTVGYCYGFDYYAAYNGHLNILQYYVDRDLMKSIYACRGAAKNGQLEALKFLHENGWSWHYLTLEEARNSGHLDCYNYAKDWAAREKNMRENAQL
jgi:hypothetical protein